MKKVLWSTAAAALFALTLTGCAGNAPVQTEDRPPQAATGISAESTAPVEDENEIVFLSAGDDLPAEDSTASGEPTASPEQDTTPAPEETPASAPAASAPQETPPPVRVTVTFEPSAGKSAPETKGTEESPSPHAQRDPGAGTYPNCNPSGPIRAATGCWDNPITAGAHCTYLERDIQSRLNRYAKDDTILDVWIWAEPHTDGSYDLYIGYA